MVIIIELKLIGKKNEKKVSIVDTLSLSNKIFSYYPMKAAHYSDVLIDTIIKKEVKNFVDTNSNNILQNFAIKYDIEFSKLNILNIKFNNESTRTKIN